MQRYAFRIASLILLAALMVFAGVSHFRSPAPFVAIVPSSFPHPRLLVAISGACEIAGGLGLLLPLTRRAASFGLIALYIAVFPANINMAVHHIPIDGRSFHPWILWARLPLQIVLILWAWNSGTVRRASIDEPAGIWLRPGESTRLL